MSEINVTNKDIVVPGEILAVGMDSFPGIGTYREGENIIAARLGLVQLDGRTIKLIPLSGRYIPKKYDTIICKVIDVNFSGWRLDTNSPYSAMLSMKEATSQFITRGADLTKYYDIGDYVVCKIINVTSQKLVDVTMKGLGLRKLKGGRIINVASNKVPRIEDAYDPELRNTLLKIAKQKNITLHEGVYFGVLGPSFETPAEIRAFQTLGGDVVAMSLINEVITARHCGLRVAAISAISNMAAGLSCEKISHELTLSGAKKAAGQLKQLVMEFISQK